MPVIKYLRSFIFFFMLGNTCCFLAKGTDAYYIVYTKGNVTLIKGKVAINSTTTYLGGDSVTLSDGLSLAANSEIELISDGGPAFVIDREGKWNFEQLGVEQKNEKGGILANLFQLLINKEDAYADRYMREIGGISRGRKNCPHSFYPLLGQCFTKDSVTFNWNKCDGFHYYKLLIFSDSTTDEAPLTTFSTADSFIHVNLDKVAVFQKGKKYYWVLNDLGTNNKTGLFPFTILKENSQIQITLNSLLTRNKGVRNNNLVKWLVKAGWLENNGLFDESKSVFEELIRQHPDNKNLREVFKMFKLRTGYEYGSEP